MDYEGQICRTPMEKASFMLPVMVGCNYNGCKFCDLFRHLKYRELPMELIEDELKRVKEINGNPKRIFFGDGNAFSMETDHLIEILELVAKYFPDYERVNMDATVTSILNKTDEELKALAEHKVKCLYLGIESGLDDVLEFMNKEHTQDQAREAIRRIQKWGMEYSAHIMTGVSGHGRGQENAEALAKFLLETKPVHVCNFSMFLHKEVPLYKDIEKGTFTEATEQENLEEEKCLITLLGKEKDGHVINYEGFHDFISFRVRGNLPNDQEKMLEKVEKEIEKYADKPPIYAYVHGECPNIEKCDGNDVWNMCDKI